MFAYEPSYGKLVPGGCYLMSTLQTERLLLRPLAESDVAALHNFWNDPEVRRYLWDGEHISTERVIEIVTTSRACFDEMGAGFFALEMVGNPDALIGFCGYRRFEESTQPELLYGILPEHWGEGFVTEAANEVLRYGFEECGMERVIAATDTPNQRSVRVMQRLGMIFEERREYHGLDTVFYALARSDFSAEL